MKIHSQKILSTDLDGFRTLEAQQSGDYEWKVEELPLPHIRTSSASSLQG
jgi:hypothetical protein